MSINQFNPQPFPSNSIVIPPDPISLQFLGFYHFNSGYTNLNLGDPAANRIIVMTFASSQFIPTAQFFFKIDGQEYQLTKVINVGMVYGDVSFNGTGVYLISLPTGTTASLTGNLSPAGIGLYRLTGMVSTTPVDTIYNTASGVVEVVQELKIKSGGVIIGSGYNTRKGNDPNSNLGDARHSNAHLNTLDENIYNLHFKLGEFNTTPWTNVSITTDSILPTVCAGNINPSGVFAAVSFR